MKKKIITIVVVIAVLFICFISAKGLVNKFGVESKHKNSTAEEIKGNPEEIDVVETPDGKVDNQSGNNIDKAIQSVYDFFNGNLPDLGLGDLNYEIKTIEDGSKYGINIGDWYIVVTESSNICYPSEFYKDKPFTYEEKKYIERVFEGSTFTYDEVGGFYEWKVSDKY